MFVLIACFADRAGEVLTRDDLIETVWGGRIVSDSAISTQINAARAALGDDGASQRVIRTAPRRGFRFEAAVGHSAPPSHPPLPDKPSLAVLPFRNMSSEPEQEYFADGISEDIITELCRIGWLFVIAHNTTLIPTCTEDHPCAHWRIPMDMIFHGRSTRLFQASQQSATMSS